MTWRIIPQETRGELRDSKIVRYVPVERDGETEFLGMKPPVIKVIVEHIDSKKRVTITHKGNTYTITNPDRDVYERVKTRSGRSIIPWDAQRVAVPGLQKKIYDRGLFETYVKDRFGQRIGEQIVQAFNPLQVEMTT